MYGINNKWLNKFKRLVKLYKPAKKTMNGRQTLLTSVSLLYIIFHTIYHQTIQFVAYLYLHPKERGILEFLHMIL